MRYLAAILILSIAMDAGLAAAELRGQVTFGGLPVPGATITATQNDKRADAITELDGAYTLTDVAEGVWTIRVEMSGFEPASREVTVAAATEPLVWELALMPLDRIVQGVANDAPNAAS